MIILGIDTSDHYCTIILLENNKIINFYSKIEKNPAEKLSVILDKLLSKIKITYNNIDIIAPISGPGGLMGIRISMALAIGIHNVTKKPIVPINKLELLAFYIKINKINIKRFIDKIISIIYAKNDQFFYQIFQTNTFNTKKLGIINEDELINNITTQTIIVTNEQTKIPNKINKIQIHSLKHFDIMKNIYQIICNKYSNNPKHCTDLTYFRALYC